jgi:alpha-glucosidase
MSERILRAIILLAVGGSSVAFGGGVASQPLTVTSPDGNISVAFELKTNPQPYLPGERAYYRVSYRGKPVLADSPLGLDFKGARALDRDFAIVGTNRQRHDEAWQNPFGAQRNVRDHYNQLTISLRERSSPGRRVDLIFRAYDESAAFRYFLPKQEAVERFTLAAENTGFYFPRDVFAYALNLGSFTTPYEAEYPRVSLDQIKPTSIVGLPLLVEMPQGPWVALLEADLKDYAGMYVGGVLGTPNALMTKLSPLPGRADEAVTASAPKATPWRVLLINPRPGGLIESNYLVLNLSEPCAVADTSWIHPGKVTFPWWSGFLGGQGEFQHNVNTATFKHYIDFASNHHLEYIEISDYWYWSKADADHSIFSSPEDDITRSARQVDLPDVLAYAKQRGVMGLLWVDWEPLYKQLDAAFPLYEKWGAAGVKVDMMNRDDQEMVNFYERVARKAAEHHLVVYFHGAYKPTGLRRTYPNVLNREGVMGMEYDKVTSRVTPEHDVTLPFTRMLAGPLDYTPGSFHNVTRDQFKPRFVEPMSQGTRAHQLAMYVVYETPLAMVSDYPEAFQNQPEFEFIEKVPTVWDETRVLGGEPARYVTVARRHGRNWYVGAMTNWDARDCEVPLDFLGQGEYAAKIFADGPDAARLATSVNMSTSRVKAGGKLNVHLAPGGGMAVILEPVN